MPERRRLLLAGVGLLAVVVLAGVAFFARGSDVRPAPADDASRLVPAGALVFVHVSTDTARDATARALKIADAFPGFAGARRSLLARFSSPQCRALAGRVRGREAALALVDTGTAQAGSLVLVDTGNEDRERDRGCGVVQTTKLGRFLVVGQPQTIDLAKRLSQGRGRSLHDDALYRRATDALPADRVGDGWVTAAGARRLLAPQSGLLGAAGTLLDQPALRAAAFAVTASDASTARLTVRTELRSRAAARTFTPSLVDDVPAGAVAYFGARGLGGTAAQLLAAAGGGAAGLEPLLSAAADRLRGGPGRAALDLLSQRETAVFLLPRTPAPVLVALAQVDDEASARRAFDALRPAVARVLKRPGAAVPVWRRRGDTWRLPLADGVEVDYTVAGGKVIVATAASGIAAARQVRRKLVDEDAWGRVVMGENSDPVSSLGFLDFRELLALGERTGLGQSAAYREVQSDLRRVRAVGAESTPGTSHTTTEILFSLP